MNDITETADTEPLDENKSQDSVEPTKFKQTFINRFGHIRAGWRMMIYLVIVGVLSSFPFRYLHKFLKDFLPNSEEFPTPSMLIQYVFIIISFVLTAYIVLKWIDKRPFGVIGMNLYEGWLKELSVGMGFGFGLLTLLFLVFWVTGLVDVTAGAMNSTVAISMSKFLFLFILVGFFEELMTRGYLFQAFIEGSNRWIAAIILSLAFSLIHMANPNFSASGALNIFLAGMLLSIAYLKTLSLWMPIGIHIAWNWTQGPLWGMNVSGIDIKDSFLVSSPQGPELLSGGEFGAEGSLISAVAIAALCWYLWKADWIKPSEANASIWRKYPSGYGVEPVDREM